MQIHHAPHYRHIIAVCRLQTVVLRGLNLPIDAKLPDFEPLKNKTALHVMPLYGANIARVLFTWEAFEPTRANYSMEYLDYYLGLVEVGALKSPCRHLS